MDISVIVCIHGVEKYLEKCLSSLKNQTFKGEYEVLCMNDAPSDDSPLIIDKYVNLDPTNFKKIDVFNHSQSLSRNDGILKASGKYISFVDGDDFVANNYLDILYKKAINDDADIITFNFSLFKNEKIKNTFTSHFAPNKTLSSDVAFKKLTNDIGVRGFSWNKLIKREFLIRNDIKFYDVKKTIEDILFTSMIFIKAKNISFINDRLYFYRINSASMTQSGKKYRLIQLFFNCKALIKIYCAINNRKYYFPYITNFVFFFYMYFASKKDKNEINKKDKNRSMKIQFKLIKNELVYKNTPWEELAIIMINNKEIKETKNIKKGEIVDLLK